MNITDILSEKTGYEDFRYVLQTRDSYCLGSGLTYADCMVRTDVPFKFRAITEYYLLKDGFDPETTLESHLYHMKPDDFSARTYAELRIKVKVWMQVSRKKLFSKDTEMVNRERLLSVKELTGMDVDEKKKLGLKVGELVISKLALMGFTV